MKYAASIALTVASTSLIGFWALALLVRTNMAAIAHGGTGGGHPDSSAVLLVNAVGLAGLAFAIMAFREVRRLKKASEQLEQENKGFV